MATKKERGRFNIKLNENDPAQEAVIRLLEKQPPRGKAQFVATALLYYAENHIAAENKAPAIDRAAVEAIVHDVLRKQKEDKLPGAHTEESKQNMAAAQTGENNEVFSLVADTMSAFRSGGK